MSGKVKEKILLYRLQIKKDPEAYAELYDLYVKQIYRFVYFKVGTREEAEDITSEVFLKTWHFLQAEPLVKSFSGLLYRIARNCIIDSYRRKLSAGERLALDRPEQDVGDGGRWYADLALRLDSEQVVSSLQKLKQEYQEVITLRYVDELTVEEIATITGKGNIAVRVTLHRALKKLKTLLLPQSE